ncbi:FCD domain-containing protein [Microvirga zambiensis]|uniref:FCD domain-containing protein n=1 Tax=Microvirga zambiensis TaxID=1402137 RepID=UPI00191DA51C
MQDKELEVSREPRRIVRQDLHSEVLSALREHINSGRFRPEERLNERVLCDELGISRTPLREAFKVLAAEGFVTLLPSRGAMVTPLSRQDFDAIVDVMAHLELMIGRTATQNATDADATLLTNWQSEMEDCFKIADLRRYFELNQQIHFHFAHLSANSILESTYLGLNVKLRRYRYQANLNHGRWKTALEEHKEILTAFVDKDGERLGELLRQHLLNKAASVRSEL